MSSNENSNPKDILFISSGSIGDALMILALTAEIHHFDPAVTLTVIARRNAKLVADMTEVYSYMRVVPIEKSLKGLFVLFKAAFLKKYTVLMPGAFGRGKLLNTSLLFLFLRWRPGTKTYGLLKYENDKSPYTISFPYASGLLHIDNLRKLANAAGFRTKPFGSPLAFEFIQKTANIPGLRGDYLIFHPFASSSPKSFSPRHSHELLQRLCEAFPHLSVVVTGSKENETEAKRAADGISHTFIATGLPILEVVGLIKKAKVFVGVDTGTIHLASVLQQKVVALEHNASPEWLPLYNPNAIILTNKEHCVCGGVKNDACVSWEDGKLYMRCLYEISNDSIIEAVKNFLQ